MGTLLALRIQEQFEQLTPSEQRLAAVLLEKSDDILTFSATELAKFSGVSKATAARLFRSLGYTDFNEVRLQARQERNRTGPTKSVIVPVTRPEGAATVAGHLQAEVDSLTRTFELMRSDTVAAVADQLATARRVVITGTGAHSAMARHARSLLSDLRPAVQLLNDDQDAWPNDLAALGPGDVLLAIVSSPMPRNTEHLLGFVRTTRARLVAVTDPASEPRIRRFGGTALVCHGPYGGMKPDSAYFSTLVLIHRAVHVKLGEAASVRADLISGLRDQLSGGE